MIPVGEMCYNTQQERKSLTIRIAEFLKISFVFLVFCAGGDGFSAQAPNPRASASTTPSTTAASSSVRVASGRDGRRTTNVTTSSSSSSTGHSSGVTSSRSATSRSATTASRSVAGRSATTKTVVSTPKTSRSASRGAGVVGTTGMSHATASRAATSGALVRSAKSGASSARSAISNISRAGTARATAVFDNINAIGGGYATCREAYATCMDQFCAKANETYRRCFCSAKFQEFRDTEAALDEAKTMLLNFQDNNLSAVELSAAEVNAMYTATAGENAIKKDVSGAAKMLDEIGDLLAGRKKTTDNANTVNPTGLLSFDLNADFDDIWGGSGDGIFSSSSNDDLTALEGVQLYNSAHKSCSQVVSESCENDAVFTMARSSYSILISQDCNAYEKKINSQRATVTETVRQAEKMLREARLEEYRAHNSADVNECLAKVKTAILSDVACGPNYNRCLDYTGIYVNMSTGEPLYTPRLFELENLIKLDFNNGSDILRANQEFNSFLESRKMFATSALDTCRDIAETVWNEFKRAALIEIAQAQSAKLEEVRMSCVDTMAECYDTQTESLKNFDDTTSKMAGAVSAYAAKAMCQDKVATCALLYGGNDGKTCKFDSNGHVSDTEGCGLTSLLNFVNAVDNNRVAEGCATAVENYLKETCAVVKDDAYDYPWGCRTMYKSGTSSNGKLAIKEYIEKFAASNCKSPDKSGSTYTDVVDERAQQMVNKIITDIQDELEYQMADACSEAGGYWISATSSKSDWDKSDKLLGAYYSSVHGGRTEFGDTNQQSIVYGKCVESSVRLACEAYNEGEDKPIATYNAATEDCTFADSWYESQCLSIGGVYEKGICYYNNKDSE